MSHSLLSCTTCHELNTNPLSNTPSSKSQRTYVPCFTKLWCNTRHKSNTSLQILCITNSTYLYKPNIPLNSRHLYYSSQIQHIFANSTHFHKFNIPLDRSHSTVFRESHRTATCKGHSPARSPPWTSPPAATSACIHESCPREAAKCRGVKPPFVTLEFIFLLLGSALWLRRRSTL